MFGSLIHRVGFAAIAAVTGVALVAGAALAWTGHVQGEPSSFEAGGTDGYYVWHDDNGLHLRTTDSAGGFAYSGVLRTDGTFVNVDPVRLEADDKIEVDDGGKVIRFQFKTAEGVDGVNFEVSDGSTVHFLLSRDGDRIDPANIFLGEDSVHPDHNGFTIRRDGSETTSPTATPIATPTT